MIHPPEYPLVSSPATHKENPVITTEIKFRGSAAEYDPDYLLDQEIVLVTLQYRFPRKKCKGILYKGQSSMI